MSYIKQTGALTKKIMFHCEGDGFPLQLGEELDEETAAVDTLKKFNRQLDQFGYYIVFIHLYSAAYSAHQSEALPVRDTHREKRSHTTCSKSVFKTKLESRCMSYITQTGTLTKKCFIGKVMNIGHRESH